MEAGEGDKDVGCGCGVESLKVEVVRSGSAAPGSVVEQAFVGKERGQLSHVGDAAGDTLRRMRPQRDGEMTRGYGEGVGKDLIVAPEDRLLRLRPVCSAKEAWAGGNRAGIGFCRG